MIEKENFHVLNYVKKEEYTGSMDGMRYMLRTITVAEEKKMEVIVWPEPYAYGHTPEELKIRRVFDLSEEGVENAADYLNEQYTANIQLWNLK